MRRSTNTISSNFLFHSYLQKLIDVRLLTDQFFVNLLDNEFDFQFVDETACFEQVF